LTERTFYANISLRMTEHEPPASLERALAAHNIPFTGSTDSLPNEWARADFGLGVDSFDVVSEDGTMTARESMDTMYGAGFWTATPPAEPVGADYAGRVFDVWADMVEAQHRAVSRVNTELKFDSFPNVTIVLLADKIGEGWTSPPIIDDDVHAMGTVADNPHTNYCVTPAYRVEGVRRNFMVELRERDVDDEQPKRAGKKRIGRPALTLIQGGKS
jgi:hypothetical protein